MTPPVLITDGIFWRHAAAGHPERPERLAAIVAAVEADEQLRVLPRRPAPEPDPELARLVHHAEHLELLRRISEDGGGWIDSDTYCGPRSHEVALRAAGAAALAVDAVMEGAAAGVALVRPPGHHASQNRAMGFCLLNNAAVAIRHAQRAHGCSRAAVIDIDVHHGNGTQAIFDEDRDVLYTSLHQHPFYPGTGSREDRGRGAGAGTTLNVPLREGTEGEEWLAAIEAEVVPAVERFEPELIVVSAGFDAHEADPLAGLRLGTETYARAAERIAALGSSRGRGTVWTLEGGYDLDALGRSVVASLRSLAAAA